jgi:hypothetical protein
MKYSVDYAEGFLEGLGYDVVDTAGKPLKFRDILRAVSSEFDFDYEEEKGNKLLDCLCTDEFVKVHPIV